MGDLILKRIDSWKEVLDQFLHALVGGLIVFVFSFVIPLALAAFASMTIGILREIRQRLKVGLRWWQCGAGCRLDLLFWAIGILIAALLIGF